jgi:hypothetical protein
LTLFNILPSILELTDPMGELIDNPGESEDVLELSMIFWRRRRAKHPEKGQKTRHFSLQK